MMWDAMLEPVLAGAGMTVLLVVIGLLRLRRADAGPIVDPEARERLEALARRAGVRARFRLLSAPGERIAALAVFDGRVFVTQETAACQDRGLAEFVVLHELAHLARRDAWRFALAIAAATALWVAYAFIVPSGPASWVGPGLFVGALLGLLPWMSLRAETAADARAAKWMGDARAAFDAFLRGLWTNHPGMDAAAVCARSRALRERVRRLAERAGVSPEELERRLAERA